MAVKQQEPKPIKQLRATNPGILVTLAIFDAYGGAFEYSPVSMIEEHNTAQYYAKHPRHNVPPGFYTDDTQMTLAIVEALLSGEPWTKVNLTNRFVEVFKRDPRKGYAKGFYAFLKSISTGKEFRKQIKPDSDKSGGAMRATVLGLLPDMEEVIKKSAFQAALTHNTPDGISAAIASSLLIFYANNNLGPVEEAPDWIQSVANSRRKKPKIGNNWNIPWEGKVKSKGWMSTRAAITAFSRNTDLKSLLIDCVDFRGDVDTVAVIAGAAAARSPQYQQNLPETLIYGLENGTYGYDYLLELDRQLNKKYPR